MIPVDDSFIETKIMANGSILNAFPQLNAVRSKFVTLKQACTTCSGKEAAIRDLRLLFNEIRKYIATMPSDLKSQLKTLLGVHDSQLFVAYRDTQNGISIIKSERL